MEYIETSSISYSLRISRNCNFTSIPSPPMSGLETPVGSYRNDFERQVDTDVSFRYSTSVQSCLRERNTELVNMMRSSATSSRDLFHDFGTIFQTAVVRYR